MNIFIVNCFDTYDHRVELLYNVFTEKGHTVRVETSEFSHFEKKKRQLKKENYRYFEANPYSKNISLTRLRSHALLSKDIFSDLDKAEQEIDLLWVFVPPNSFVKDAAALKRKHPHIKLVFDIIDLWPESMPVGRGKNVFPLSVWRNLRDKNISSADLVVTECNLYRQKLRKVTEGIRTQTLYLARPSLAYNPHPNLPEDKISLCYIGSINSIIDIELILTIIRKIQEYKPVQLHILGDGERIEVFVEAAQKAHAFVISHGKVFDREEKCSICDRCHFGLNIMKEAVSVGLTMKSLDYFEFGLPMINNIKGDTWEIIERYRCGVNLDNSRQIDVRALEGELLSMRRRSRHFFEEALTEDVFKNQVGVILQQIGK